MKKWIKIDVREWPNDGDLGKKVREMYWKAVSRSKWYGDHSLWALIALILTILWILLRI